MSSRSGRRASSDIWTRAFAIPPSPFRVYHRLTATACRRFLVPFHSDGDRDSCPARAHRRLAELERDKIAARRVQRLAAVFNCAQEFAHGASEAVIEPGTREKRAGQSGFGMELDRLMTEVGALAGSDAIRPDDRSRIARAVSGRAVEDERGLTDVKGDKRLGQKRRPRGLAGGSGGRCINGAGAAAHDARQKIEPMDAKIPEDEVVHGFERRPCDPAVVPADLDMNAGDFPDQAR